MLQKVASIGYEFVQLQGASYEIPDPVIAAALRDNGLECVALQEDFPVGFRQEPERAIERAAACGCRYLSFAKWPGFLTSIEEIEKYAESLLSVQKQAREAGLTVSFHPIGPDFQALEGIPVYERLLSSLPPETQLTFCVSSSFGSGVTPYQVLEKFSGRVDLVHFKERVLLPDGRAQLKPLGEGETDWASLAAACKKAGTAYIFAEQEQWDRDAFDCAAASCRYLSALEL